MTNIELLGDRERKYITKEQGIKIYNHEVYIKADTDDGVQIVELATREERGFSKSLNKENVETLIVIAKEEKLDFDGFIDICRNLTNGLVQDDYVEITVFSCWDF